MKLKYLIGWSDQFISSLKKICERTNRRYCQTYWRWRPRLDFFNFKLNNSDKSSRQYPNCRATEEIYGWIYQVNSNDRTSDTW